MQHGSETDRSGRRKPLHLGLQGGGAHGALAWGVLDRLLEDGRFDFRAASGASAGAMNAVVLADGLARGGPEGARAALADFWQAVGAAARLSPMRRGLWDRLRGRDSLDGSAGYLLFDGLVRLLPPRALNPLGLAPLRDLLSARVDFDRIAAGPLAVHVAATNVRTGDLRVFSGPEVGLDAVMASVCLPQLYPAVEIDGEAYWDGGFSGNPPLLPLADDASSRDILIVQLNPVVRDELPSDARAIINRMNEIGFNASLVAELRALGWADRRHGLGIRLHRIHGEADGAVASSKLDAEWRHLERLFHRGRAAAESWLAAHADDVGAASTFTALGTPPRRRSLRDRVRTLLGRPAERSADAGLLIAAGPGAAPRRDPPR